jgi:hypothetical protein
MDFYGSGLEPILNITDFFRITPCFESIYSNLQGFFWKIRCKEVSGRENENLQKRLVCSGCFFFFFAGGSTIFLTLLYNHSGKIIRIPSSLTSGIRDRRSHFTFERTIILYNPFPIGTAFIITSCGRWKKITVPGLQVNSKGPETRYKDFNHEKHERRNNMIFRVQKQ